jgi:hypothetical protein
MNADLIVDEEKVLIGCWRQVAVNIGERRRTEKWTQKTRN